MHVPVQSLASRLQSALCDNEVLAKQFGTVEVYWGGSLAEQIEFLAKGIADLILSKDNIMEAMMAESTQNYMPLIGYPSYTAFFISSREKPKIEKAYFLDKKIGLVDYPTSRSGHILPKQVFKQLDIDVSALSIVYASSHSALRDLLSKGEVDIIASYWQEHDQQRFSKNYITPIADNVSGSKWYIKMSDENTDLACSLQNSVNDVVNDMQSNYFSSLKHYWQCMTPPYGFIEVKNDEA
ncbi:PhnD/SsuA/transferrin family substrate-binding protein [Pseudoalteromonas byunsanensis]|uniref:PhnD/SsuA/transferrin family substrate-binding protein n=1 Tax=Pseudoalteromonas byunsanensis TaxID=327939 RepID=UPI001FDFB1E0|nr:PhnD/SsuA/transferrin family substrate-binding protein [Pseudoalteromonas byunsanensis]